MKWYRSRKYEINENCFDKIDTEQKAYVLGLLFSDGNVSEKGRISICVKDVELLEIIRNLIGPTYPIKKRVFKKKYELYELIITSNKLAKALINLGCVPNKSLILKFPNIPKNVEHHFIRGLWDGDGGVRITKLKNAKAYFCGSKDMVNNVHKILKRIIKNKSNPAKHVNIWRIEYSGNIITTKLKEFLYQDSSVYLKRKKIIFDSIIVKHSKVRKYKTYAFK